MDRDVLRIGGVLASMFASYLSIFIAMWATQSKAAEEKARERRMAEHRMNARLLRFNI